MREVYLMMNNVEKVTIQSNTFDQIVINAVFRDIKELELSDKSFLSCWGSVWLFKDVGLKNSPHSKAFSSSDLVVHNGTLFTVYERPKVTPRLKFSQIYEVSAKVYDLGISLETLIFILKQIPLQQIKIIQFFYSDRNHHLRRAGADRSRHPDVNLLDDRGSQKIRFAIISVGKSTWCDPNCNASAEPKKQESRHQSVETLQGGFPKSWSQKGASKCQSQQSQAKESTSSSTTGKSVEKILKPKEYYQHQR